MSMPLKEKLSALLARQPGRPDAAAKAAGQQKYPCDLYGQGLLWAGVKRAGVPHARLLGVDVSAARALPGVAAVLTAADIKGPNRQGVAMKDQPVLVDDKVRYEGDAIALVVADSPQTLAQALALVRVELQELPGVFDPEAALAAGAPLIHDKHPTGNLLLEGRLQKGRGAAALAECAAVSEIEVELPRQEHAYLETEAGWARLEPDGMLRLVVSTQTPFRDCKEVAEALGLDPARIRLEAPYPGGAFGGKDGVTVQSLLALAALACPGRPIKMWLSREESLLASAKRHPAKLRCRLGALAEGDLHALDFHFVLDSGPYDHLGTAVMVLGLEHAGGPYRIPHASLHGQVVYTNNPLGGAFRGFGVPQVTAAVELCLDDLARRLAMDPLALRQKNAVAQGDDIPSGTRLTCSVEFQQCLAALAEHPWWRQRETWQAQAPPFKRRGVGVAAALHGMGYGPLIPDVAGAKLELLPSGGFRLYCGVVDMGQGNAATFQQMAAAALDQELSAIELVLPDTGVCLPCGSSSASRTTYTFASALLPALQEMRERILAAAARHWGLAEAQGLELSPGCVRHLASGRQLPLAELAGRLEPERRLVSAQYQAPASTQRLSDDQLLTMLGLPHVVFAFCVQLAAIEVDELSGRIEVARLLAITDCGRVINPQTASQQIEGALIQGLGYALMEEAPSVRGHILTPDLATYLIPTALDAPRLETLFVENFEPSGPLGMKGLGEVAIDPTLPAIGNALGNALAVARGISPRVFPLTPERALALLENGHAA